MCRHLLPRFDFPVGQILHSVGRIIAAHPATVTAVVLVPLCAVLAVLVFHRLRRPAQARWNASSLLLARRRPMLLGDGYGSAPSV